MRIISEGKPETPRKTLSNTQVTCASYAEIISDGGLIRRGERAENKVRIVKLAIQELGLRPISPYNPELETSISTDNYKRILFSLVKNEDFPKYIEQLKKIDYWSDFLLQQKDQESPTLEKILMQRWGRWQEEKKKIQEQKEKNQRIYEDLESLLRETENRSMTASEIDILRENGNAVVSMRYSFTENFLEYIEGLLGRNPDHLSNILQIIQIPGDIISSRIRSKSTMSGIRILAQIAIHTKDTNIRSDVLEKIYIEIDANKELNMTNAECIEMLEAYTKIAAQLPERNKGLEAIKTYQTDDAFGGNIVRKMIANNS